MSERQARDPRPTTTRNPPEPKEQQHDHHPQTDRHHPGTTRHPRRDGSPTYPVLTVRSRYAAAFRRPASAFTVRAGWSSSARREGRARSRRRNADSERVESSDRSTADPPTRSAGRCLAFVRRTVRRIRDRRRRHTGVAQATRSPREGMLRPRRTRHPTSPASIDYPEQLAHRPRCGSGQAPRSKPAVDPRRGG